MIENTNKMITTEICAIAPDAVGLLIHLNCSNHEVRGLVWEVREAGELEPLRYGLCLPDSETGQARIAVTGLRAASQYEFQVSDGSGYSAEGRFSTLESQQGRHAA